MRLSIYSPWAYTIPMSLSDNGYYSTGIGKIFHVINGGNDPLSWEYSWLQGGGSYGGNSAAYQNSANAPSSMRDHDVATKAVAKLGDLKSTTILLWCWICSSVTCRL